MSEQVPHSFSADGTLKFGDTIMLSITHKDAADKPVTSFLANNIWNRVDFAKNTIAVTATGHGAPVARNTFVISRPFTRTGKATGAVFGRSARAVVARAAAASTMRGAGASDDTLRYGDRFYLATNPSLRVDDRTGMVAPPFLLMSELANSVAGSGKGDAVQDVVMTLTPGAHAEWKVAAADGDELASDGTPVPVGAPVVLVHCVTNQALAAKLEDLQS